MQWKIWGPHAKGSHLKPGPCQHAHSLARQMAASLWLRMASQRTCGQRARLYKPPRLSRFNGLFGLAGLFMSFHCPHRADNLAALAGINILRILEEASGPLTPSCAQSPLKAQPVLASRIEVRRAVDEGRTRKLHTFMLFRDQRTGLHVGG